MAFKFNCEHCDTEIISNFLNIGEFYECRVCNEMTIIPEDAIQTERQQRSNRHLEVPIADDETDDLLKCNECGEVQNNNDALYCLNCGNQLYPSETINVKECPSCNSGYDLSYNYCQNDGTLLEEKTVEIEIGRVSDQDSSGRIQKTENVINEKNTIGFGWVKWHKIIGFIIICVGFFIKNEMALPMMSFPVAIPIIMGLVIFNANERE